MKYLFGCCEISRGEGGLCTVTYGKECHTSCWIGTVDCPLFFGSLGLLRALDISMVCMGTVSSNDTVRGWQWLWTHKALDGIVSLSYSYSSVPMRVICPMESNARSSKAAERTICRVHELFMVGFCTRSPPRKYPPEKG